MADVTAQLSIRCEHERASVESPAATLVVAYRLNSGTARLWHFSQRYGVREGTLLHADDVDTFDAPPAARRSRKTRSGKRRGTDTYVPPRDSPRVDEVLRRREELQKLAGPDGVSQRPAVKFECRDCGANLPVADVERLYRALDEVELNGTRATLRHVRRAYADATPGSAEMR